MTELVNEVKLRASIRRMFSNELSEAIGELYQNSQRAKAKNVWMTTTFQVFKYEDDGEGINGIEGLKTLLTLGGSEYDPKVMAEQNPMGLGINALLTLEDVTEVVIESNRVGISIDTKRWWEDPNYWQNWRELTYPCSRSGFMIRACFKTDRVPNFNTLLNPKYKYTELESKAINCGYYDLLKIYLNGKNINQPLPTSITGGKDLIYVGQYQGNLLKVTGDAFGNGWLLVNWYGQIIKSTFKGFQVYLEVREGRPVEPKAPVRDGLIKDSKYQGFINHVTDMIFAAAMEKGQSGPLRDKYMGLDKLDKERFNRTFIGVRKVIPYECEDSNRTYYDRQWPKLIYPRTNAPLLVSDIIIHQKKEEDITLEEGLDTFANSVDFDIYTPISSEEQGEPIHWYPEEFTGQERDTLKKWGITLVQGGHFTISNKRYELKAPVLAYKYSYSDMNDLPVPTILGAGLSPTSEYKVTEDLRNTLWSGFYPNDDDWEGSINNFQEDIETLVIELADGIEKGFSLSNIQGYIFKKEGLSYSDKVIIQNIQIIYSNDQPEKVKVHYLVNGKSNVRDIKLINSWEV